MSQNFSNQGFEVRTFYGLLGMRLTYNQGAERWDRLHFIPPRACRAEALWSQPQYKLKHFTLPSSMHSKTQEQVRIFIRAPLPSSPFMAPLLPLLQRLPASPTGLVMIHEQFFPVALLHCRNCGSNSRITE